MKRALPCFLALALPLVACKEKSKEQEPQAAPAADAKADTTTETQEDTRGPADTAAPPPSAEAGAPPSEGEKGETGGSEKTADDEATSGPAVGEGDPPPEQAKTDGDESGESGEGDPLPALWEKIKNRRTSDEEAMAALEEAKTLEAPERDIAKAATRRGQKLFATPERATPFLEYGRDADPKYADASFHLAKISANRGEIGVAKEHLAECAKRGGKRLLKTLEYDPTFALLADDPEVQKYWQ